MGNVIYAVRVVISIILNTNKTLYRVVDYGVVSHNYGFCPNAHVACIYQYVHMPDTTDL